MERNHAAGEKRLRIGIDVGGTSTDGVVIDPARASEPEKGILAWPKTPTTPNPSDGIRQVMQAMIRSNGVMPSEIATVTIGTTHFVNTVVQRDAMHLSRVAVLRLREALWQAALLCVEWPSDLRDLVLGHHALLRGGSKLVGNQSATSTLTRFGLSVQSVQQRASTAL